MPSIGLNNFLVKLIHEKTKVPKQDIVDILKVMAPCMAEAFIHANLPAKETLDMGGIRLSWSVRQFGPAVSAKTSDKFRKHLTRLKIEGKYPLALHFYHKMHPRNKKVAENRIKITKDILIKDY